jgi:hypothetical protein
MASKSREPKKRKQIDIETKLAIVNDAISLTQTELTAKYDLAKSTIATIVGDKAKILQYFQQNVASPSSKRLRGSDYGDVEEAVMLWFEKATKTNVTVDGPLVKAQALKYATMLGHTEFKASCGWLENFKKRQQISWKRIVGEAGLTDGNVTQNYISNVLPALIKTYNANDIFNADETALYYKAMPDKTLFYKNLPANHVAVEKERLTLLFCANMSGSEKLKPVLIGKSANPRCFKLINKANLPVYYRNNKSAWMTDDIFREWLSKIDRQFKSENRKVLLFLDNFSGHCDASKSKKAPVLLSNTHIVFFPPNCTSVLQPMDQGIIQSFKMKYRRSIVEDKMEAVEHDSTLPVIDILAAIHKVDSAWKGVTSMTIRNCFQKAGFSKETDLPIELEADAEPNIMQDKLSQLNKRLNQFDFNQFAYVSIDEDLPTRGEITDEQIIDTIIGTHNNDDDSDDDVASEDSTPKLTSRAANDALDTLRLFLMQADEDNTGLLKNLDNIGDYIGKKRQSASIQTKITSFF